MKGPNIRKGQHEIEMIGTYFPLGMYDYSSTFNLTSFGLSFILTILCTYICPLLFPVA